MAARSAASGLFGAGHRAATATVVLLLLAAVLVPVLNLAIPANSAAHIPTWVVSLLGKYLAFALLALSVDLIWGYCGILSLGHGAFFALGGYAMGMHLMREIGGRGVYGNAELPDFMVFLNWQELPWYWHGFESFPFAVLMVTLVPGLLALVFGWFAFRSRVGGVYLSIITQALTFALMLAFFRNDMGFGGNNGLTDFKDVLGRPDQALGHHGDVAVERADEGHVRARRRPPVCSTICSWRRPAIGVFPALFLLLREIVEHHSVVVVEHDMAFVRSLDCHVTVLHEGSVLAEGSLDTGAGQPAGHRSVPGAMTMEHRSAQFPLTPTLSRQGRGRPRRRQPSPAGRGMRGRQRAG